jgi:hypothetical protein
VPCRFIGRLPYCITPYTRRCVWFQQYLAKYGYLQVANMQVPEECDDCPAAPETLLDEVHVPKAVFKDAVRKFQRMAKLKETGETDSDRVRYHYNGFNQ